MTSCVRKETRTHLSSRPHPRCCQTALLLIIWSPLPSLVNVHTTTDHNYHPLIAAFQIIRGPVLVKLSPSRWQDAEVRTCEVLLNPEIEAGGITVRHWQKNGETTPEFDFLNLSYWFGKNDQNLKSFPLPLKVSFISDDSSSNGIFNLHICKCSPSS